MSEPRYNGASAANTLILGEHEYLIGKLAARAQLHVIRRLTPMLAHLAPALASGGTINAFQGLAALTDTVHELSDADIDFVMDTCLDVVRYRSGERYERLRAPGGVLMLPAAADDLAVQLRLVWEVLVTSLQNFSLATLLPSTAETMLTGLPISA